MTSFRQELLDTLGLKPHEARDLDGDEVGKTILRKIESLQRAHRDANEREVQWQTRFNALAEKSSEADVEEAKNAAITTEKMELLSWLDTKSDDFLGTGLNFSEWNMKLNITQYQRSFSAQLRDEKKRRTDLIIRLAVEYRRVRDFDMHGTGSLRSAIEDIIDGKKLEDFDETIEWMTDHEMSYPAQCSEENRAQWKEHFEKRDEVWKPAVAICKEFTGAFKPPPEGTALYDAWQDMVEREPGLVRVESDDKSLWMYEHEAHIWGSENFWNLHPTMIGEDFLGELFDLGVRWHGPSDEEGNGYWHMANREKFPDDPEKFWGNNYYRIYDFRELHDWHYRNHKEKE